MPFDGKAMLKGGWHPSNDRAIKKETWKSDLKGIATGKKKDPYEQQRNHTSAPLTSLRDPDSFGPPPKARSHYDQDGRPLNPIEIERKKTGAAAGSSLAAGIPQSLSQIPTEHRGGLGAPIVETGYKERRQREMEERERREQEELNRERGPYQKDTTGIDTRKFAPPPRHYAVGGGGTAAIEGPRPSPALPPRVPPRQATLPPPPSRQTTGTIASQNSGSSGPPPFLPPRQNEYPDEHTPAPPPTYGEALNAPSPPAQPTANKFETAATNAATRFGSQAATSWMQQRQQQQTQDPAAINQGAAGRLAGAGVSVPGFGIGRSNNASAQQLPTPSAQQVQSAASFASGAAARFGSQNQQSQGQDGQLNELQQRFARMGTGSSANPPAGQENGVISPAAAAQKKPPPPPPPKKAGLQPGQAANGSDNGQAPPPVPMSSKPKW